MHINCTCSGWWINVPCFALHNSKEVWGDDADDFVPERWLPHSEETTFSKQGAGDSMPADVTGSSAGSKQNPLSSAAAYSGVGLTSSELSFFPFSYGTRNCVGMNLAVMELKVSFLALVKQFKFELANSEMADEENALVVSFTMHPADMLPVRVYRRC